MATQSTRCAWCGRAVEAEEGWRLQEAPGARVAVFCRLEHIVPWSMQGAPWEPGQLEEPEATAVDSCARCGERLGDVRVTLVRHRGAHRIADGFCSVDHLAEWAKAGGRWG
jgi:hypothetical protein